MFHKLVRWDARSIANWERTRESGKKRYVWRIGVLGWGGFMFLAMTPFIYIQKYGSVWPSIDELPLLFLVFSAFVWLIAGYWFGSTMWSTMERAYETYQQDMDVNHTAS